MALYSRHGRWTRLLESEVTHTRSFPSRARHDIPCFNITGAGPANSRHWSNADLVLGHRLRRWPNIKPALCQCLVCAARTRQFDFLPQACRVGQIWHRHHNTLSKRWLNVGPALQTSTQHWTSVYVLYCTGWKLATRLTAAKLAAASSDVNSISIEITFVTVLIVSWRLRQVAGLLLVRVDVLANQMEPMLLFWTNCYVRGLFTVWFLGRVDVLANQMEPMFLFWTNCYVRGLFTVWFLKIMFRIQDSFILSTTYTYIPWWHCKWPPFLNAIVLIWSKVYACWKWPSFHRHLKYSSQFHGIRVFWMWKQNGGQCDWAYREVGGPVIPDNIYSDNITK